MLIPCHRHTEIRSDHRVAIYRGSQYDSTLVACFLLSIEQRLETALFYLDIAHYHCVRHRSIRRLLLSHWFSMPVCLYMVLRIRHPANLAI